MSPVVLIGSLSESRLIDYQATLENYGMRVVAVSSDQDCFRELARHPRGSLLIESAIIWSDPERVTSGDEDQGSCRDIPLVLFANTGPAVRPAEDVRMPVLGVFPTFPSREELLSAISSVWESDDAFIVEEPNYQSESCPR